MKVMSWNRPITSDKGMWDWQRRLGVSIEPTDETEPGPMCLDPVTYTFNIIIIIMNIIIIIGISGGSVAALPRYRRRCHPRSSPHSALRWTGF